MQSIFSEEKSTQDREAEIARERELAAVEINPADVELIASDVAAPLHTPALSCLLLPPPPAFAPSPRDVWSQMELDKAVAERKLRENRGDVVKTLVALVEA